MAHYKGAASEAGRAMQLMKKRVKAQQEIEYRRKKIEEDLKISNIENKFAAHYDAVEQQLKSSTIGLVTLDEMKAKQEDIVKQREKKLAQKQLEKEQEKQRQLEAKQAEKNRQKRQIQALSFSLQDDEEDEDGGNDCKDDVKPVVKKIKKNPDVDTSFLPDRDREEEENALREELRQEWASQQATVKEEEIQITFSYWDGSGHRRTVKMKKGKLQCLDSFPLSFCHSLAEFCLGQGTIFLGRKGNSIYQFLQRCLELLRKEFSELKTVMADQLMYVKEDLILPHHYTFYDFIVTKKKFLFCWILKKECRFMAAKFSRPIRGCPFAIRPYVPFLMARGKSGPLFTFDVHDDVRLTSDASIEKEDSHAGKVLLRSWYERNKHIFPASRWEPYDPTKTYDKYTIADKNRK